MIVHETLRSLDEEDRERLLREEMWRGRDLTATIWCLHCGQLMQLGDLRPVRDRAFGWTLLYCAYPTCDGAGLGVDLYAEAERLL